MPRTTRRPQQWKSVPGAADYAGVSSRTIRRWIAEGKLPARRVGPRLLQVDLADVDEMIRPVPTVRSGAA
jgi:excisionase family DNA binding protein